jgi:hypothetical protein
MFEVDAYFVRGDWTVFGQIGAGKWAGNATNGKDASWTGASVFAAYKITPRFEVIGRLDRINNEKNGGGTIGAVAGTCSLQERDPTTGALTGATDLAGDLIREDVSCADGRNGFGPGMQLAADSGEWEPIDPNKGVNRSALSLGISYLFNANTTLKLEYRVDRASAPAFLDVKSGAYEKSNQLLATSVVVTF